MAKTVLGNRKPVFDIEKLAREQNENIKKSGAANVPSTPVKVQPEQVRRDILKERGTIVRPLPTVKRTPHPPHAVPLPLKGKASAESRKENAINTRRRGLVPYSIQDIEAEKKRTEQLKADVERRTPTEVTANKKTYTYTPSSQTVGHSSYGLKFDVSKMGDDFINTNSPFGNYRITSKTGARKSPTAGASTNHAGIDRDVPEGTVISLPMDTTFHASGYDKSRGFWIEVKDASGNILHYQHLMDYGRFGEGEKLSAGTPIARSGSSGVGTAHLHEEYYSPDGRNITESYWAKYAGQSAEDIEKWKKEKENLGISVYKVDNPAFDVEPKTYKKRTMLDDIFGKPDTYKYINDIDGYREKTDISYSAGASYNPIGKYAYLTNNEIAVYNKIYTTYGEKAAERYLENIDSRIMQRIAENSEKESERIGREHPVFASVSSVAFSPAYGLMGVIEQAKDTIDVAIGKDVDQYSFAKISAKSRDTMRNTVSKEYASKWFDETNLPIVGNAGEMAYGLLMSFGDMAMSMAVSGGNSAAASLTMAGNAMSSTVNNALENGYTDEQAVALGWISGASEMIFEKISIEKIMKPSGKVIGRILKSMAAEAQEEGVTELVNILADTFIAGENSDYERQINELVAKGVPEREAIKSVLLSYGGQVLAAGISGAIMGGGMSAAYSPIINSKLKKSGAEWRYVAENIIQTGLDSPEKSIAYKNAKKLFDKGIDNVTNYELGLQRNYNIEQIAKEEKRANKKMARENDVNTDNNSQDTRFAIKTLSKGRKYVQAEEQVIKSANPDEWEGEIIDYVNRVVRKGQDVTFTTDDGEDITITGRTAWKLGDKGNYDDQLYFVKGNASGVIDEVISVSKGNDYKGPKKEHSNGFASQGFRYKTAFFRDLDGKYYRLNLSVGINTDGKEMYNIGKIEEVPFPVSGSKATTGTAPSMTSIYKNDGIVNNFLLNQENGRQRQFGKTQKKFFDAFGVEVLMDESLDANAEVLLDDGVVKVSPYADIDDWKITRHEFTHLLKVLAPEAYELYARLAREEIGDRWDTYYEEAKRDYTAYYEKKGKEVTDDLIKEEVFARYAEGLDNNDFIRKVARESTSVAVKVRNILKRIVDKIKAVFSSGERAGTPENIKKIITAKDAWENAAIEAARSKGKGTGTKQSITQIKGKKDDYGIGVYLDTDLFEGIKPRNWGRKLREFVYNNLAGETVYVYNEDETIEAVQFARKNERVKKDGSDNFRKVIDKLARKSGNVEMLSVVHIDELLNTSKYENSTKENVHNWLDANGWEFRKTYVQDIKGRIYEATLNIAKARDGRKILYDITNIKEVDNSVAPNPNKEGYRLLKTSSRKSISQENDVVNSKLSVPRNERTDSFRWDLFNQEMKFLRGLESENAHLKEVNDILKRFFRQTAMVHVDALHISEYAEQIKKTYETHMPAKEIATELQRIYTKMAEDGARAESDVQKAEAANVGANALFELAGKILEQSDAVDRSMYDRYAELRHALRTDGISISESDARDIPDFNDFRRQNMGRVKISSDGISVDSYYEELVELYPELFASEEITAPSDRLLKIVKVRDMLDPKYRDVAYTDDEAAALAVEMYAEYFSDENAAFEQQSLAAMIKDKYAKSLREEYNDKLKKTVDFYREQVEFYRNLNQNVEERIADVPMGEVQRNGFVDTEIKKEFSWYESGLKDTGVKVVRRQSPGGKKDTVLMTFERPTREALRNNSDYNEIISRVKERIKQDWEEGKSGKTQFGYSRSNVWRSFRRFFGDRDYRKMKELILDPLEDSKKQFMHIQEFYSQLIYKKVVKELGIKKGSELSALVQKYGEKVLTAEELEAISEEDMKKIQIADRLFRACYDGLIDTVNDTRRAIYPDADEKAQKLEDDILNIEKEIGLIELGFMTGDFTDVNGFNNYNLERIAIRQESAKELEYRIRLDAEKRAASFDAKITKLEEDMAATANKTTKRYADLQERLAKYQAEKTKWAAIAESRQVELQEKIAELNEEFRSNTEYYKQKLDKRLARLNEKLGEKKALLETDEITYGRTIQKRKDYYRHFEDLASEVPVFFGYIQQMTQDNGKTVIQAAKDYFERRSQKANIDNRLAGKSADTKPRAKWQSFAQHRTDGATAVKYDAVGGFLEYLPAAAYSAAIDPQISIFRTIAEDLAAKVDGKDNNNNLGSFIGYLQEYANDLAGKTNPIDRVIVDSFMSRDSWNKLNWLTGRIKSNMIGLNVSSMFAQILNMPNAIATIKNPVYFIGAMRDVVAGINKDSEIADRYKQSQFLNERYINYYSKFEGGFSGNARKVSDWMLQAFDELGGRVIWNAAYRKAVKLGEKSPVRYADDLTRRLIAGRKIGEMQLYQKSRLMGMIMPFSVEVANNWDVIEDIARDAALSGRKHTGVIKAAVVGGQTALGLLMLFLANRLFNELLERLRGSDGGLLDPIGAIEEGIKNGDDVGEILGSIAGDAIGATPVGSAAATLYPEQGIQIGEYSTPTRSELFGSNDPTRYGTGNLFSSALKKPINYLAMPTGGAQLDKTLTGIKAYKEGAVTKKNGDTLYEVDRNPANAVKGALFGKSGLTETKEYYDKKDSGGIYDKYLKPKGGIKSEQFKELNRLIKIDDSIKPSKPGMSFVYNDMEYKPNGRYYDTYEKMYGRRASQYYNKLMLSSEYKAANDELKVVMVKDAFRAALSDAKAAYVKWIKSGADKDGGSFEQSFVSDFIGKKIVGNSDAAKSFSAEGFNKGKGYAEVQHDGKTFILQGDAYNAYEQARYDAYVQKTELMNSSGTMTVKNEPRTKNNITKMKAILKQLVSEGSLDDGEAQQIYYKYAMGEAVEVPAGVEFVLGRQEECQVKYADLTSEDKKKITKSLNTKIKNGEMTVAQAKQYIKDVQSGKKTVTKKRYITGDFNSLTDAQQEKVLGTLNDKVKDVALEVVKERLE